MFLFNDALNTFYLRLYGVNRSLALNAPSTLPFCADMVFLPILFRTATSI